MTLSCALIFKIIATIGPSVTATADSSFLSWMVQPFIKIPGLDLTASWSPLIFKILEKIVLLLFLEFQMMSCSPLTLKTCLLLLSLHLAAVFDTVDHKINIIINACHSDHESSSTNLCEVPQALVL